MLKPTLDPRLLTAADFFPYCENGADIGADHGHLSCYLLSSGKCRHMQVTDISATSLEKAKALFAKHNIEDRATFCVGDGLHALQHPVQALAICGMGGHTLAGILEQGKECLHGATLILSPQTEHTKVRKTIYHQLGYHITREVVLRAANRFYLMMQAQPGYESITERELYLGPCLIQDTTEIYAQYLQWRHDVVSCERSLEAEIQLEWLQEELFRIKHTKF